MDILNTFLKCKKKPILIPTSDFAVSFIDRNYNSLKNCFLTQNCDNSSSKIIENMSKYKQQAIFKKLGLQTIKSTLIDINNVDNKLLLKHSLPCIIKPNSSFDGKKSDISICNNENEIINSINSFKNKNYKYVLIQNFIDYNNEIDVVGFAFNGNVYFSAVIEKKRISPPKKGSTSFGRVNKIDNYQLILNNLSAYFKLIKYNGIFDVDVFETKDAYVFNEVNFRNGANTYSLLFDNVNLPFLWINLLVGNSINKMNYKVNTNFHFRDDVAELREFLKKNIKFKEYLNCKKISRINLFFCKNDIKPFIFKYIYAVLKRLKGNKQ